MALLVAGGVIVHILIILQGSLSGTAHMICIGGHSVLQICCYGSLRLAVNAAVKIRTAD